MLLYYLYAKWMRRPGTLDQPVPVPPFGSPTDASIAYCLYQPDSTYLSTAFIETTRDEVEYADAFMASLTGDILKADHTFKVCCVTVMGLCKCGRKCYWEVPSPWQNGPCMPQPITPYWPLHHTVH